MKYALFIFLTINYFLGFGQKANKTFINSEWWIVHGPSCMNFSCLKFNINNFVLCIHKPREKFELRGNILHHGDTLLIKINDLPDYINGFLIQGNNAIVSPDLARYISSKEFQVPNNILVIKNNHLNNLDRRKKKIILKKKIRACK